MDSCNNVQPSGKTADGSRIFYRTEFNCFCLPSSLAKAFCRSAIESFANAREKVVQTYYVTGEVLLGKKLPIRTKMSKFADSKQTCKRTVYQG
jgi:hypothetical protein